MAKVAYPRVVSGIITLIVGIVLAAVMLGVGWICFKRLDPDLVESMIRAADGAGLTGLGVMVAGLMIGIGLIISQALAAIRPK